VIDALDECKDENVTSTILLALAAFRNRLSPLKLKLFITSRPVVNVQRGFRITGLMNDTSVLVLHSIPPAISHDDILIYLAGRLSYIARSFGLEHWPSQGELDLLVERSSGLFIFAAVVAKFIEDRNASNPIHQLAMVISATYIASSKTSPHVILMHFTSRCFVKRSPTLT
jgi:hypothetical protein